MGDDVGGSQGFGGCSVTRDEPESDSVYSVHQCLKVQRLKLHKGEIRGTPWYLEEEYPTAIKSISSSGQLD